MRIGNNPNSNKVINVNSKSHRVIIPVYIPHQEEYFKDSLKIFKICIESLVQTINSDTAVTLISNGSCTEVNDYLIDLYKEFKVDKVVLFSENVGKMNAIISETRSSYEEFITFSDADVFFDKGWLKQTFEMFNNVAKAGFISMNPTPQNYTNAYSTILNNYLTILKNKKSTKDVCDFSDLTHFHSSIGKDSEFTDNMLSKPIYTLTANNYIIGAGHFCCTIRKTPTLKFVPKEKSNFGVSGNSEAIYLDIPFDKTGYFRLSSPKAFVWHMGNTFEKEWALSKLEHLKGFKEDDFSFSKIKSNKRFFLINLIPYFLRIKLVSILRKTKILK
jgi:hypothetical protein